MWRKKNCITPLNGEPDLRKELLQHTGGQLTSYKQPTQAKIGWDNLFPVSEHFMLCYCFEYIFFSLWFMCISFQTGQY